MENYLGIILLIYFLIYFGIAFVLKTLLVAKRIGKNPLVLPKDDTAFGLIGRYFKLCLVLMFLYVLANAVLPNWPLYDVYITALIRPYVLYAGLFLLMVSLIWTIVAQMHMKDSWRIGIDHDKKSDLVTAGLFSISRNPIFLGMILSLLGLFLCLPTIYTSIFLVMGYVLIQIQIRLEEEFLLKEHGDKYKNYMNKVRRFI